MYRCPICKCELNKISKHYECVNNHNYDISKEGYVNLVVGKHKVQGDNSALVKARTAFLQKGYYAHLRDEIQKILEEYHVKKLIDLGCGEGYYSNYFASMDELELYGFDLSKDAIRHASRFGGKGNYAVSNIFDLPLSDSCADAVVSIFTPIPKSEIFRVLKQNGIFIQVEPGEKHLYELKGILYDEVKENVLQSHTDMNLDYVRSLRSEEIMHLRTSQDIQELLSMTPYAYTTSQTKIDQLLTVDKLDCLSSFYITVWRKR